MPTYDPIKQRMAVRVVYDGVAWAGKTTNLRQLCTLFAAQRSAKLYSPADANGRTLYFDWMQIMAGVVCGYPLLCQVMSVPGQVVLTARRRHLLSTADVIVYVCESGEQTAAAAAAGLALYDEVARERGATVPLVVQANKQDRVGALDGPSLLRVLGREGTPVVEGIASEGIGVVDTFVTAVRTVVRAIQTRSEADGFRVRVRRAETAAEVLTRLAAEHVDPAWAAELLLEEAQAALVLERAVHTIATDDDARAAARAAAIDLAPPAAQAAAASPSKVVVDASRPTTPPLPSPDVPTGFIWPAHTGRATVRGLSLPANVAPAWNDDGEMIHVALDHVLRTSRRSRFSDRESARQALVRRARECTQLDRLLVPETVLIAQPAEDGACWLWTVRPKLKTLSSALQAGTASSDLVASFGSAVVDGIRSSLRHGFTLSLCPDRFGIQQGMIRYIGELSSEAPTTHEVTSAVFASVEALERAGADASVFLDAFERELSRKLTADERARAGATTRPPGANGAARATTERLDAIFARGSGAA
ncbi:MAG: GTPase domain-containing protein [Polyangiaceae bacterium]|nr:GTPase domain-containing protein [Polyangiaceae bacterium]